MARVTVVNDNPEFLALVGEILSEDRYTVTLIDGEDASPLKQIKASHPDVLVIDLRMGTDALHGRTIAQAVRAEPVLEDVAVLVCTADVEGLREVAEDLERTPRVAALRKPFGIDELPAAIDKLLSETGDS